MRCHPQRNKNFKMFGTCSIDRADEELKFDRVMILVSLAPLPTSSPSLPPSRRGDPGLSCSLPTYPSPSLPPSLPPNISRSSLPPSRALARSLTPPCVFYISETSSTSLKTRKQCTMAYLNTPSSSRMFSDSSLRRFCALSHHTPK